MRFTLHVIELMKFYNLQFFFSFKLFNCLINSIQMGFMDDKEDKCDSITKPISNSYAFNKHLTKKTKETEKN